MMNRYNLVVEYKDDGLYQLTVKLMNVPNEVKIIEMYDNPKENIGSVIVVSGLYPHGFTYWLHSLDTDSLGLKIRVIPQFHATFTYEQH